MDRYLVAHAPGVWRSVAPIRHAAFSRDGRWLLAQHVGAPTEPLRLLDLTERRVVTDLAARAWMRAVAFVPDGALVFYGGPPGAWSLRLHALPDGGVVAERTASTTRDASWAMHLSGDLQTVVVAPTEARAPTDAVALRLPDLSVIDTLPLAWDGPLNWQRSGNPPPPSPLPQRRRYALSPDGDECLLCNLPRSLGGAPGPYGLGPNPWGADRNLSPATPLRVWSITQRRVRDLAPAIAFRGVDRLDWIAPHRAIAVLDAPQHRLWRIDTRDDSLAPQADARITQQTRVHASSDWTLLVHPAAPPFGSGGLDVERIERDGTRRTLWNASLGATPAAAPTDAGVMFAHVDTPGALSLYELDGRGKVLREAHLPHTPPPYARPVEIEQHGPRILLREQQGSDDAQWHLVEPEAFTAPRSA